jgi:hypothetical protein
VQPYDARDLALRLVGCSRQDVEHPGVAAQVDPFGKQTLKPGNHISGSKIAEKIMKPVAFKLCGATQFSTCTAPTPAPLASVHVDRLAPMNSARPGVKPFASSMPLTALELITDRVEVQNTPVSTMTLESKDCRCVLAQVGLTLETHNLKPGLLQFKGKGLKPTSRFQAMGQQSSKTNLRRPASVNPRPPPPPTAPLCSAAGRI